MDAISAAVLLGRDGDAETARRDLLTIWKQLGVTGDPFHRCTLAHYMAELHEDPGAALVWDVRALDAADTLTDERAQQYYASLNVAGFYPSLYVNLADHLRRVGSFEAATEYVDNAEQHTAALSDDAYGTMIRAAITEVRHGIDRRDTAPRAPR